VDRRPTVVDARETVQTPFVVGVNRSIASSPSLGPVKRSIRQMPSLGSTI